MVCSFIPQILVKDPTVFQAPLQMLVASEGLGRKQNSLPHGL